MKIAAAAYPLTFFDDFAAYAAKLGAWVGEAAAAGADLLVFPEYGAMELASLGGAGRAADQEGALVEAALQRPAADRLCARLAAEHGVYILGASGPVFDLAIHADRPVNRATFFGPAGIIGHQDKAMMTRFEREDWHVVPGPDLSLFETRLGRIGISICYDSEFPLLARRLAEAGCEILLVPSATEALAGFTRVRVGAMARALENQLVAIHSPVVGLAPWCAGMEENAGRAAIYGPPDRGFPPEGILAEGAMNQPGWTYADISLKIIREVRADGGVLNLGHWPEQLSQTKNLKIVTDSREPA